MCIATAESPEGCGFDSEVIDQHLEVDPEHGFLVITEKRYFCHVCKEEFPDGGTWQVDERTQEELPF